MRIHEKYLILLFERNIRILIEYHKVLLFYTSLASDKTQKDQQYNHDYPFHSFLFTPRLRIVLLEFDYRI